MDRDDVDPLFGAGPDDGDVDGIDYRRHIDDLNDRDATVDAEIDAKRARERRAVVAGVEVEREVGRLEVLTARLLRADAVRRTEMIDGIVKGNLSRWPSLQPSWKKR